MSKRTDFGHALENAASAADVWRALEGLSRAVAGFKLFTVTTVDMAAGLARRAYSSHPDDYPVSGTKPISHDSWFETVHERHELFVANTIADIAEVFPDHEKIRSMGLGSVVNLPVVIDGEVAATINLLHQEHHYTPERVQLIREHLSEPARLACRRASGLN